MFADSQCILMWLVFQGESTNSLVNISSIVLKVFLALFFFFFEFF